VLVRRPELQKNSHEIVAITDHGSDLKDELTKEMSETSSMPVRSMTYTLHLGANFWKPEAASGVGLKLSPFNFAFSGLRIAVSYPEVGISDRER
jgi:hypothetical protein